MLRGSNDKDSRVSKYSTQIKWISFKLNVFKRLYREVLEEKKPLVIPLISNTKTSSALAALKTLKHTLDGITEDIVVPEPVDVDILGATLEQQAAHEILNDLREKQDLNGNDGDKRLVLPVLSADDLPLDGAKESTIEDYESVPVSHFGMAILRGMGFKETEKKPNEKGDPTKFDGPMLRLKGMGLGADKMIKPKPLLVEPAKGEVLEIKKNCCVRVLYGKYKDQYGLVSTFTAFFFI